jgi:hypothetical protein
MKLHSDFEETFSNGLFRESTAAIWPWDSEKAYKKPPLILKIVPEADFDTAMEKIDQ